MSKTLNARICQPIDTEVRWLEVNPTLLKGERVFVETNGELKEKIGDGETPFSGLKYLTNNSKENGNGAILVSINEEEFKKENNILTNTIPAINEQYIIKYENVPYVDANNQTQYTTIFVEKVGDGTNSLKNLSPLSNIVYGEGEGTSLSFLEGDLYELVDEGKETVRTSTSTAIGKGSLAFGRYNRTYGRESAAFNYNNIVHGEKSFATGQSNLIGAAAKYSFVNGIANETVSEAQVVVGTYANVDANDAFVIGNGSVAKGKINAFRVDKQGNVYITNNIDANNGQINANSIAVNNSISAKHIQTSSILSGSILASGSSQIGNFVVNEKHSGFPNNVVLGYGSAAMGGNNEVYGNNSLATITSNKIPATSEDGKSIEHVFIAGHNNTATYEHQVIVGTYSDPQPGDRFIVGNGRNDDPDKDPEKAVYKNAFVVETKGNIRIGGNQITLGDTTLTETELQNIKSGNNVSFNYHIGSEAPSNPTPGMLWFEI